MRRSFIPSIVSHLKKGSCALFVGQDLSESAQGFRGLPTSWQLAKELADKINYRGRYLPLPQIAQIFEKDKEHDRKDLVDYFLTRFTGSEYRPLPVHELITRLPFSVIVTASWDTLLETALTNQNIRYDTIVTNAHLHKYNPKSDKTVVFKPFGSIEKLHVDDNGRDSLVITEDDQLEIFFTRDRVIEKLKGIIENHALLLIGYAPYQDSVFVRLFHEILLKQPDYHIPAVAVQSLPRAEDANVWKARDVEAVTEDPVEFLLKISEALAKAQKRKWVRPDLTKLSTAPRLTPKELEEHGAILDDTMDHIGVADLIEQTSVPLLSEEQLREIEAMRTSYERLMESFSNEKGSAHIWLRQGNLEYVRKNYERASEYYQQALSAEPELVEAYHNLHYVRLAQKDWKGALRAYQKAVAAPNARSILPERYQIDQVLGGGGVGIVYRAKDSQTNRLVAIKVLHPSQVQTEQIFKGFEREATILQQLKHTNIVEILDYQSYMGVYYIVMEYLEGKTLKETLVNTSNGFSLDRSYHITKQVSEALTYAHGLNIVHRDIKPSNILLVGEQVKVIDFGLAREMTTGELTILEDAGTATYMAPEQIKGKGADARTDEYALASVFYEMMSKVNPAEGTYRPLSEKMVGINSALDLVIEHAREHNSDDRYPTVKDFQSELSRVVALQAAASDAPVLIKVIARIAQAAKVMITRGWIAWLAAGIVLGFLIPLFLPAPVPREVARYAAAGMLITIVLTWVAGPFTAFIARRTNNASVAAYGPLMGMILGFVNSILWMRSFSYYNVQPEPRLGYAGIEEMIMLVVSSILLSLGIAILVFLVLLATSWAANRWQKSTFTTIIIVFMALTIFILIAAFTPCFGWFGDLSNGPAPPPCT